jgi:hypothetical protein
MRARVCGLAVVIREDIRAARRPPAVLGDPISVEHDLEAYPPG